MIDRLESILEKYNFLTEELGKQETLSNIELLTKLSKEQSALFETVEKYKEYKSVDKQITDDLELLKDPELKDIAKEELVILEEEKEKIIKELEIILLPKDENDDKNVIMEIRGAAGGDEANFPYVSKIF